MSTEFHNEPDNDSISFWNKGPGPVQSPVLSRSQRWLIPALTAAFVLIIIIAFGVSSSRMSGRLWTLEETVSNLSQSLNDAHRINKDAVKDVQRLNFSVEANKDQLTSVAESLKQLSRLDFLSRTVASLRCSLEHFIHNSLENNDLVVRRTLGTLFWIGLTDERGKWEWFNGTPYIMDPRRWHPGQPDSWTGHGKGEGDEDCAQLDFSGELNDLHCSTSLRFICKRHTTQSS